MSRCVWLTGRSGAGKTTVGRAVAEQLRAQHQPVAFLDDEDVATYLNAAGASARLALSWLCRLLVTNGVTTIVAASMPSRNDREQFRDEVPGFVEVFVDAPPEICEARIGRPDITYEDPYAEDLKVPTFNRDPAASAAQVLSFLE